MNRKSIFTRRTLGLLLACLSLSVLPSLARAANLTFMKADGILGESVNANHPGEIELTGYSQSFGTRNCSRAVANKFIDRASPLLISRAASNQLIPTVVISMHKEGEGHVDFFKATLNLVSIERIDIDEQSGQLLERVVLAPRSITIEYRPQTATGAYGALIVSTISCA